MKKIIFIFASIALSCAASDSLLKPVNDLGYGTWALRAQTLSMYRDYEGIAGAKNVGNGYSTTLGWKLDYSTPEWEGLTAGFSYIHVDVLHTGGGRYSSNGEGLLSNGDVNELNEFWLKYNLGALGLSNTFVKVGRQVLNGEVLRKDEFRQKPRSFEAAIIETREIPDTVVTVGHAERISNVWDNGLDSQFRDLEDVLGSTNEAHGVTWVEAVYTGITNLEVAVYDAYAHDIANIFGGRIKYNLCEKTAVNGYYRHEGNVGGGAQHRSNMYGASIQQKLGDVTVEPGFLSISGDDLLFSELGTGINHPLGSSMMIYGSIFNGGADTYYLKATTKIDQTVLYALYTYTTHDRLIGKSSYNGHELNFVAKQALTDRLTVALKVGVGVRDGHGGTADTTATDARLFVTYNF